MSQAAIGANRRASRRRPPKGSTKIRCYRGPMGLGANLAFSALDVSENGASLVVIAPFKKNEDLEIHLEGVIHRRPILKKAIVVWCMPTADDQWCIGVRFQSVLRWSDLTDLAKL